MQNDTSQQVPIADAMRMAIEHHQAGRVQTAETIYRAILAANPSHGGANYNVGLIALQTGRAEQALPVLKAALASDPNNGAYWLNYGVALATSGNPAAARSILLKAREHGHRGADFTALLAQVERMPDSVIPDDVRSPEVTKEGPPTADTLPALKELYGAGKYSELETVADRLTAQVPDSGIAWHLLGAARLAQEKYEEARLALARAHEIITDNASTLSLLGLANRNLKRNEEARLHFAQSLALAPDHFDTLLNASANAATLGLPDEARHFAERAVALQPDSAEALRVLGDAMALAGGYQQAADVYRRAIAIDPSSADLLVNLGDALVNLGKRDEATAELRQALSLRSDDPQVHLNLGRALYGLGEIQAAREHFRIASALAPAKAEAHTAYLFCLAHDGSVTPELCYEEHVRIGDLIESPLQSFLRDHENDRDPDRDLRIGFVSGDLRNHAVAYLIEPVWQAMKYGRNRIIAYSNVASNDPVRERLQALADEWVPVDQLDDDALCDRIRADRIDILVDLSGHTTHNRLTAFARKPAPVQVSWIGYPGTTGLSAMDYRFVRGVDAKDGALNSLFREQLVSLRLRGFQPEISAPAVNALPALSKGRLTFGSFNRTSKLGESVVALWSRVLKELPESRLLIANVAEARVESRLGATFSSHGVAAERIDFRRIAPIAEYLAMHHEVDIALDTFPYTGGTTTSHALWMGVPVLTLAGRPLQQNQAASKLRALGLSEWATDSEEAFVRQAIVAASNLDELANLRQNLRESMSAELQDSLEERAGELDVAFRTIWQRWCTGQKPESFNVEFSAS